MPFIEKLNMKSINVLKVFLFSGIIVGVISSCAFIPAGSSPEISEDLKKMLKSERMDDGYKRAYVCMGEASTYMPDALVLKNLGRPVKNTKINFFLDEKIISSINSNEAVVFDYKETNLIKFEWSMQVVVVGDGLVAKDTLWLKYESPLNHVVINTVHTIYRGTGFLFPIIDAKGNVASYGYSEFGGTQTQRTESVLKDGGCADRRIVSYKKLD
jgi:hypothetical protein